MRTSLRFYDEDSELFAIGLGVSPNAAPWAMKALGARRANRGNALMYAKKALEVSEAWRGWFEAFSGIPTRI